jgi:hypothetical protein
MALSAALPAAGQVDLADNAALQYWKAFASVPATSDQQMDALKKALDEGTLDSSLRPLIASSQPALRELHKGARLKQCAWGISREEGINAVFPHLSKARQLTRLACLRAEASFQDGQAEEAIEDIAAVMTLARHVGQDSILISLLVDYAIEAMALETVAAHLPSLDADQLKNLSEKLDALPHLPTVSQAVQGERDLFIESIIRVLAEPDGKQRLVVMFNLSDDDEYGIVKAPREELLAGFQQMRGFYDRLAEAVSLPPEQAEQAEQRILDRPGIDGPARPMALQLVPAVGKSRKLEATHQTRLALVKAAVAVQLRGANVLKDDRFRDPFGSGPFVLTRTDSGFLLRSTLTDTNDQPIELTVGRP